MKKFLGKIPVPVYLLLVVLLAYGIYIPWFGFYGDDWSYIWYQHLLGFGGSGDFAAYDRPFSALYYNVVIYLLGESVWPYQVYLLLLRWLSGVLLWLILGQVWKNKAHSIFWVAALFLIFPGFGQEPIAVEFILHFAVLDLFLLSLLGMILAMGSQKGRAIWLTIFSMGCAGSMFGLEYFIGLEVLRPIFIWRILGEKPTTWRQRIKATFLYWLPYLGVMSIFAFWRIFVFKFPTYGPGLFEELAAHPAPALAKLVVRVISDLKTVLLDSWQAILHRPGGSLLGLYLAILAGSVILSWLFFVLTFKNKDSGPESGEMPFWRSWPIEAILVGGVSLLAAGVPFWITSIPLSTLFPWDRTSLPFMFGASLIMTALFELVIHPRFLTAGFAVLIGLTLGYHLMNADVYHQEWQHMKSFYWQLTWRAPGLKPGTIIMSDQIPLYKVSDSGMSAPLNWTYAPDHHDRTLPYNVFDLDVRLDGNNVGLTKIEKGLPLNHDYRSLFFTSSTDNVLVFLDKRDTCLHILSSQDDSVGGLPAKVLRTLPLSNPDMIITNPTQPARPPTVVFGQEPTHDWCYYYQKADLARQMKDWKQVMDDWNQAAQQSMKPLDLFELLPFIEASANQKDFDLAGRLSDQVSQNVDLRKRLCSTWNGITSVPELVQEKEHIHSIIQKIGCNP